MSLAVCASPGAARSELAGVADGCLRVRVHAPAHEGRANTALLGFIAQTLGVPPRDVDLVSGAGSRRKLLRIQGITLDQARRSLRL